MPMATHEKKWLALLISHGGGSREMRARIDIKTKREAGKGTLKLPMFFVTECRFRPSTGGDVLPSRLAPGSVLKCRWVERENYEESSRLPTHTNKLCAAARRAAVVAEQRLPQGGHADRYRMANLRRSRPL